MNSLGYKNTAFMRAMKQTTAVATTLKKRMIERKLDRAYTICPRCSGRIDAALVGKRKHLRMACQTPGCIQMIE